MIRRTDIDLDDDQLEQLLHGGNLGRNADIVDLISVIDEIEGSFSIFLDGKWGSGKTYFVKQAKIVLRALNNKLKDDRKDRIREINEFKDISLSGNYYPVYYNAWKCDSDIDPLITLMATLVPEMKDWDSKIGKDKWKVISAAFETVLNAIGINVDMERIREALGKDILEPFDQEMKIRKKFEELVDILIEDKADRLVLFIDELDRCSPTFAMKLLERIKFVFGYEKIIVVFSTNVEQLGNMVKKLYGEGTDGYAYLSRFYDMKFQIREVEGIEYISLLVGADDTSAILSATVKEMTESFTLRDCNKYLQELQGHIEVKRELGSRGAYYRGFVASTAFWHVIAQILLAVKIKDPDGYKKILSGYGSEQFVEKVGNTNAYKMNIENNPSFEGISASQIYGAIFSQQYVTSGMVGNMRAVSYNFIINEKRHTKTMRNDFVG